MPSVLSYRRAVLLAITIITLFLLLRATHTTTQTTPGIHNDQVISQDRDREAQVTHHGNGPVTSPTLTISHSKPSNTLIKSSQRPLTDLSHKPLRSQISYYFPYEPWTRFPAYVWQTWRANPSSGDFPDVWRPFEASWTELHPGFIHEVVTDAAAVSILSHLYSGIPDIVEAYTSLPRPVLRADFFRYLILLARGGIYSDMDTIAIRSAVAWVPSDVPRESYGLVVGIEADPDRPDWAEWYSRRIQFCQWTIQSKPGHPVLREIVARITEETLARKREGSVADFDVKNVVDLTGPAIWTDTIFDYFNDGEYFNATAVRGGDAHAGVTDDARVNEAQMHGTGVGTQTAGNVTWQAFSGIQTQKKLGDVVVLPITCFSPGVGQMGAGEDTDDMAMVKHLFEGSWKPEEERHIGEVEV